MRRVERKAIRQEKRKAIRDQLLFAVKLTLLIGIVVYVVTGYLLPTELHGYYVSDKTVYEDDPIYKDQFVVYTTTRFGKIKYVKNFSLSTDVIDATGKVEVTSKELGLSAYVSLYPATIVNTRVSCNSRCYEDHLDHYAPSISETVYYSDGTTRKVPVNSAYTVDKKNSRITYTVASNDALYQNSISMTTVTSITTKDKVSTKKSLSSDKLKLILHYSDGTTAVADKDDITSDDIKKPQKGENKLTCYYNDKKYVVNVNAYQPVEKPKTPSVTFDNYGTYELQYSKAYDTNTFRLNTWIGVVYFNNHRETYYSDKVLPGPALNIPGRHVAEDGTVRDQDGYICVAADFSFLDKYSVVLTTLGPAKVYDTGCAYGTVDLYVDW